jgi:hypothetical protein
MHRLPQHAAVAFSLLLLLLLPLLLLQAGMARFPNDPSMLVLYANYIIHVRKQPRAARQQLQLAAKYELSSIDRYSIFCAMVGAHRRNLLQHLLPQSFTASSARWWVRIGRNLFCNRWQRLRHILECQCMCCIWGIFCGLCCICPKLTVAGI